MSHESLWGYDGTSHLHAKGLMGCPMIAYYDAMIEGFEIYSLYSTSTIMEMNDVPILLCIKYIVITHFDEI